MNNDAHLIITDLTDERAILKPLIPEQEVYLNETLEIIE